MKVAIEINGFSFSADLEHDEDGEPTLISFNNDDECSDSRIIEEARESLLQTDTEEEDWSDNHDDEEDFSGGYCDQVWG